MKHLGAVAALALLFSTGCAVGNKYAFDYQPVAMSGGAGGTQVLVLEPIDQREYVVSGDEPPNFVGEQRNGYGIPFNVTTADGRPFSANLGEIAKRDLEAAGYRVTMVDGSADSVASLLRERGIQRGLVLVINEFKSDTMNNITINWDLEASVYDSSGTVVASESSEGKEALTGSMLNPPKAAREKVPAFLFERVHDLLSRPAIRAALRG